jgi:hypothetical protein
MSLRFDPAAIVGVVTLTTTAIVSLAAAEGAKTTFHVHYYAPSACPNVDWFASRVRARTSLASFADAGTELDVHVTHGASKTTAGSFRARLVTSDAEGHVLERELEDESCDVAVDGLALVLALSVDPNAKASVEPSSSVVEPSSSASTIASTAPSTSPPPATTASTAIATSPSSNAADTEISASFAAVTAIAPDVALGGEIEAMRAWRTDGPIAPAIGIAAQYVATSVGSRDAEAKFQRAIGRVDACPLRLSFDATSNVFAFRACASIEAGVLRGEGVTVDVPGSATRAWLAFGLDGRLRWTFSSLYLEGRAGAFAPFTRDSFVFENPRVVVHRPAPFGAAFGLGIGVLFS